jgi:hypothetical protein
MSADLQLPTLLRKIPETRQHGPRIVGIAATNPRALVRFCSCICADACQGNVVAGRNQHGSHCQAHAGPQLAEAT